MQKYFLFRFLPIVLTLNLISCISIRDPIIEEPFFDYTNRRAPNSFPVIVSPYKDVDWQNFGQYKAALHVHTSNSDGWTSFSRVIELHYQRGFDIVAITDHNMVTADWVSAANGLTQERVDAINRGEGRDGRGMIHIPYTNEQSRSDDLNSFFVNYNNSPGSTLRGTLQQIEEMGGISFLVHVGRYTGGSRFTHMRRATGNRGANASNDEATIQRYVDLFMEFPSCVGMEIVTARDWETANDRILWDNILTRTVPQGRFVWGFANDDSHRNRFIGQNYNIFLMRENTHENIRQAMISGSFYAVARVAGHELGNFFAPRRASPRIANIKVCEKTSSITIDAKNYSRIDWISNGRLIYSGKTFVPESHENRIGYYVRANIIGRGGIAFTQPFGIIWKKKLHDAAD